MDNEKPRRTMHTLDTSEFGIAPTSLAEILDATGDLLNGINRLQTDLVGSRTPLNFSGIHEDLSHLKAVIRSRMDQLREVRDVIELDLPIAPLPDGIALTPSNVMRLRVEAWDTDPRELTTFRRVAEHNPELTPEQKKQRTNARRAATRVANRAAKALTAGLANPKDS